MEEPKAKEEQKKALMEYVPENAVISPTQYILLVSEQVMGRDKAGNLRNASDLKLFLYQCKKTGLDPIAKQIYAIYRWNSMLGKETMTIQTGIDGYRAIAERTNLFAGSDDPTYEEDEKGKLIKASCTVYKLNRITGERMPITASARYNEYVQTNKSGEPMGKWKEMPYLMLGKCAEALALRKAFPSDLSGIYTDVEMTRENEPPMLPEKVEIDMEKLKKEIIKVNQEVK